MDKIDIANIEIWLLCDKRYYRFSKWRILECSWCFYWQQLAYHLVSSFQYTNIFTDLQLRCLYKTLIINTDYPWLPFLGFQLPTETYDEYPWMSCNSFEATRKNCPRGEACLKLKQYQEYAWSWAMKCKSISWNNHSKNSFHATFNFIW